MRESKKQPKVVVFSTPACPWCGRGKLYLRQRGIKFKDIDVAKDKTAARDMVRRTGQMGVPVLLIGSRPIVGFNKPLIDHLLGLK